MENREPNSQMLFEMLKSIKPTPTACSPEVREWWEKTALPTLQAQALSELHRNDEMPPRIMGFMKDGSTGIVDVVKATGGNWGNIPSKDATAFVHKIAAMVPGTYASVFCVEAWALRASEKGEFDRDREKYPNLGDHPDRYEVVMFQMLHYDVEANTMMQLATMIEVIKVLGHNRSRQVWRDTKFGEVNTTDPLAGDAGQRMTGRFIFGDPENPNDE